LEVVQSIPRIVSIHSYRASEQVLADLQQRPISVPVLHWWTGTAAETRKAVALGCYFSIHSAVARHSKFRTAVPPERILIETDHGWADPPAAIPCRIQWTEYLVAQQLRMSFENVRRLVWQNFAAIVHRTHTEELLPEPFKEIVEETGRNVNS
jgi:TatD DNase family protein